MKVSMLGATKLTADFDAEDATLMAGLGAGFCYMPEDFHQLSMQGRDRNITRGSNAIRHAHHGPFGHPVVNLVLEDIPKALAMYLNNQRVYVTCEKSGRYTMMNCTDREKELYDKWLDIFSRVIAEEYPTLKSAQVKRLAMENARLFISVFTPATTMEYTTSVRQINYIVYWIRNMLAREPGNDYERLAWPWLEEFQELLFEVVGIEGLEDRKGREEMKFFAPDVGYEEYFGSVYSTSYNGSLTMFAQMLRHRSLDLEMGRKPLDEAYCPPILELEKYREYHEEYLSDMEELLPNFPQGRKVVVYERGTIDAFAMKCDERLCGAVQYEAAQKTYETLSRYIERRVWYVNTNILKPFYYGDPARCRRGFHCTRPCPLGPDKVLNRLI